MRFFSKNPNLGIILKSGLRENRMAGVPGRAPVYIKFEDGQVEVNDEESIALMKSHAAFGRKFYLTDEDPFVESRRSVEPRHAIQEVVHGAAGKTMVSEGNKTETEKMILEKATQIAKAMLPSLVAEILAAQGIKTDAGVSVPTSAVSTETSATRASQPQVKLYSANGKELPMKDWSNELGVSSSVISGHLGTGKTMQEIVEILAK